MYVRRHRGFGAVSPCSPGATTIASTIQQIEGYYPGTLAYTNNNPGNLIYVGQPGASPGAGGFASFTSYDAGYQALLNQIQNYANRGLTIDQMMNLYAPAVDSNGNPIAGNNPTLYASKIAGALGVSSSTTVADALDGSSDFSDVDTLLPDLGDELGTNLSNIFDDGGAVDPVTVGVAALVAGLLVYAVAS